MQSIRTHYNCVKKTRYTKLVIVLIACFVLSLSFFSLQTPSTSAAPSAYINYQGKLLDSSGYPVTDGVYFMEFKIYDQSSGGNTLWTETWPIAGANVATVDDGLFTIKLGSITAFPATMDFQAESGYWLGVNIGGTAGPVWDGEMTPRKEITSVAYALNANRLDGKSEEEFADLDEDEIITGQYTHQVSSQTGDGLDLQMTASSDAALNTLSVAKITAIQNSGDGDDLFGLYVTDLQGTPATGDEHAIYQQGTSWDYGLYVEDDAYFGSGIFVGTTTFPFIEYDGTDYFVQNGNTNGDIYLNPTYNDSTGFVYVSGDLMPAYDDKFNFGSADQRWQYGYFSETVRARKFKAGNSVEIDDDQIIDTNSDLVLLASGDAYIVDIQDSLYTDNLFVLKGTTDINLASGDASDTSGAYLIGVYSVPLTYSAQDNVQGVLEDLDDAIGSAGLWTDDGTFTYLTSATDDLVVGDTDTGAPFYIDVSENLVRIGNALDTSPDATLRMYAADGDWGDLSFSSEDRFEILNASRGLYVEDYVNFYDVTNNYSTALGYQALQNNVDLGANQGVSNTALGYQALYNNTTGDQNTGLGLWALYNNTTGLNNTAVGNNAMQNNTIGNSNVALGVLALSGDPTDKLTGDFNVGVGMNALAGLSGGSSNIAVGASAAYNTTSGDNNIAVGRFSLYTNATGDENVSLGYLTLYDNVSGDYSVAIGSQSLSNNLVSGTVGVGYQSLYSNTIGQLNTAVGYQTLYSNTTGDYNNAFGYQSLYNNTTGYSNTGIGHRALNGNTTGFHNTAIGESALRNNTIGTRNVALGNFALFGDPTDKLTGDFNVGLGYYALTSVSAGTSNVAIGSFAALNTTSGDSNIAIGGNSLYNNATGDRNVAIGYSAGYDETTSDRLYIDNRDRGGLIAGREKSLIYGEFAAATADQLVRLNSNVEVQGYLIPYADNKYDLGSASNRWDDLYVDDAYLLVGATNINLESSAAQTTAGAYAIGVFNGNLNYSVNENVQLVLEDLDAAIGSASGLWTDGGDFTYLTASTDDLAVGASTAESASLYFNVGEQQLRIGSGDSQNAKIMMYAQNNDTGTIEYATRDRWEFTGGELYVEDYIDFFDVSDGVTNYSTAMGYQALQNNVESGASNSDGIHNTAFGYTALQSNTSGDRNIAVGSYALQSNTEGQQNTAIGYETLLDNTDGDDNVALGYRALYNNTTGNTNIGIGKNAIYGDAGGITGSYNIGIGEQTLFDLQSANYNTAIGYRALHEITTGSNNFGFGYRTLYSTTTGRYNIGIGRYALTGNVTGERNVAIGDNAGRYSTTFSNQLFIDSADNADRVSSVDERKKSLVYGNFAAATADQLFRINALTEIQGNLAPYADDKYNLGSATKRWNDLYVDDAYLLVGATNINLESSAAQTTAGAYAIGVFNGNLNYSVNENVQLVLEDLDAAIGSASGLWTDGGDFTYLTASTDDLAVGASTAESASLYFDVGEQQLRIGSGDSNNANLTMYDSSGASGDIDYTSDTWSYTGGSIKQTQNATQDFYIDASTDSHYGLDHVMQIDYRSAGKPNLWRSALDINSVTDGGTNGNLLMGVLSDVTTTSGSNQTAIPYAARLYDYAGQGSIFGNAVVATAQYGTPNLQGTTAAYAEWNTLVHEGAGYLYGAYTNLEHKGTGLVIGDQYYVSSDSTGVAYGEEINLTHNGTGVGIGSRINVTHSGTNSGNTLSGIDIQATAASGFNSTVTGIGARVVNNSTDTNSMYGLDIAVTNPSGSTTGSLWGGRIFVDPSGTETGSVYGLQVTASGDQAYSLLRLSTENDGSALYGLEFDTATIDGYAISMLNSKITSGDIQLNKGAVLENLTTGDVTLSANFLPASNDEYKLGTADARWSDLYLGPSTLHIGSSTADEGTVSYNTTTNDLLVQSISDIVLQGSGGNVGIGTSIPSQVLDVAGNIELGSSIYFANGTSEYLQWDGTNDHFLLTNDFLPDSSNSISLGSADALWKDIHYGGRFESPAHANNAGLNLPTYSGTPPAVTGTDEGDVVWDTSSKSLFVYDGSNFTEIGESLWTDSGTFTYLTDTTDILVVGGTTFSNAAFWVNPNTPSIVVGSSGQTSDARMYMYAGGGNSGYIDYTDSDRWEFKGGNIYFGGTDNGHINEYLYGDRSTSGAPIRGYNTYTSHYGAGGYFEASGTGNIYNYGVQAVAEGNYGRAVYGSVDGTAATGGYFESTSTTNQSINYGIQAYANSTRARAGYFETGDQWSTGHDKYGIYVDQTGRQGYAGYFHSSNTNNSAAYYDYAVYGETESNYSVAGYFKSDYTGTSSSTGVQAQISGTGSYNYAGHFLALGVSGANYAVRAQNDSTSGRAGYFLADAATGTTYGVWGNVTSSTGWPGYFQGGQGVYIENQLYVGDFSPAGTYNIFGTDATTHLLSGNTDVLISGNLEVNDLAYFDGAINLSNTADASEGNIRWTGSDFEGRTVSEWVSLTGGGGGLWTDVGEFAYLTASTDNLAVGSAATADATLYVNVDQDYVKIDASSDVHAGIAGLEVDYRSRTSGDSAVKVNVTSPTGLDQGQGHYILGYSATIQPNSSDAIGSTYAGYMVDVDRKKATADVMGYGFFDTQYGLGDGFTGVGSAYGSYNMLSHSGSGNLAGYYAGLAHLGSGTNTAYAGGVSGQGSGNIYAANLQADAYGTYSGSMYGYSANVTNNSSATQNVYGLDINVTNNNALTSLWGGRIYVEPLGTESNAYGLQVTSSGDSVYSLLRLNTEGINGHATYGLEFDSANLEVGISFNGASFATGDIELQNGAILKNTPDGTVTLSANFAPAQDDTYDLGSEDSRWEDLYLGPNTLHIGSNDTNEGEIAYDGLTKDLSINTDGDLVLQSSAGDVGIGIDEPTTDLHVYQAGMAPANIRVESESWTSFFIADSGANSNAGLQLRENNAIMSNIYWDGTNDYLTIQGDSGDEIVLRNGYIGINETNPNEILDVNGGILLGSAANTNNGTIQWSGSDFEGYMNGEWVSLTYSSADASVDSLWADAGEFTYLKATDDDLVVGSNATSDAELWFDVSAELLHLADGYIDLNGSNVGLGDDAIYTGGGSNNVGIGTQALYSNSSGNWNIAIGSDSLYNNIGSANIGIGFNALYDMGNAFQNTAIGYYAGENLTTGNNNTFLGAHAGKNMTTGSNNVAIGINAGYDETGSDTLYIDNRDRGSSPDGRAKSLIYGEFAAATEDQLFRINALTQIQGDLVVGSLATTDAEFWVEISGGDSDIHSIGNLKVSADNWQVEDDSLNFNGDIYVTTDNTEIGWSQIAGMAFASPDFYIGSQVTHGDMYIIAQPGRDIFVSSDLIPMYDNKFDLGTSSNSWKNGYFSGDLTVDNGNIYFSENIAMSVVGNELVFANSGVDGGIIINATDNNSSGDITITGADVDITGQTEVHITAGTESTRGDIILEPSGGKTYVRSDLVPGTSERYNLGFASIDDTAEFTMTGEGASQYFGYDVAGGGDVNGDGYDDWIVGSYEAGAGAGKAFLYLGNAAMDNTTADATITGLSTTQFGYSVNIVGDVNGDGYDDWIVGDRSYATYGRAYLYYGGSTLDTGADVIFDPPVSANYFSESLDGVGDVNGDGYDDVVIGQYGVSSSRGSAYLYLGGENMDGTYDVEFEGENASDYFSRYDSVGGGGDVNGDGYDDIIIGAYGHDTPNTFAGKVYVYYGGIDINATADVTITGVDANDYAGRYAVTLAGDVNGDGYDDILMGAYGYDDSSNEGGVMVFYGSDSLTSSTTIASANVVIEGVSSTNAIPTDLSYADVTGDGFSDILVGAYLYDGAAGSNQGAVYVFYGNSDMYSTISASNANALYKGENLNDYFGWVVDTAGDVDGDNLDDIIVGAYRYPGNDGANDYTGRAYVYTHDQETKVWKNLLAQNVNTEFDMSVGKDLYVDGTIKVNDMEAKDSVKITVKDDMEFEGDIILSEKEYIFNDADVNDVFVYDTTADDDGGMWRNDSNAQGTSWFNENSSEVRGTKREFPEVAEIVATDTELKIYDGKDHRLWMWFSDTAAAAFPGVDPSNIYAKNGSIYVTATLAVYEINFIEDTIYAYSLVGISMFDGTISDRESVNTYNLENSTFGLRSLQSNDVHVETIKGDEYLAIATDSGANVINKNNRSIVYYYSTAWTDDINNVRLSKDGSLYLTNETSGRLQVFRNIDQDEGVNQDIPDAEFYGKSLPALSTNPSSTKYGLEIINDASVIDGNIILYGSSTGLDVIHEDQKDQDASAIKYYQADGADNTKDNGFITDMMYGDTKAMWEFGSDDMSSIVISRYDQSAPASPLNLTPTSILSTADVDGVRGNAVTLDGSADYFTHADDSNLDIATNDSVSISLWVKHDSIATNSDYIINKKAAGAVSGYSIYMDSSGYIYAETNEGAVNDRAGSYSLYDDDEWHFVTMVRKPQDGLYLYIDGEFASADLDLQTNDLSNGQSFYVGRHATATTYNWDGEVDEVMFTKDVIPPNVIKYMYQTGKRALNSSDNEQNQLLGEKESVYDIAVDDAGDNIYVATDSRLSKIGLNSDIATYISLSPDSSRNYFYESLSVARGNIAVDVDDWLVLNRDEENLSDQGNFNPQGTTLVQTNLRIQDVLFLENTIIEGQFGSDITLGERDDDINPNDGDDVRVINTNGFGDSDNTGSKAAAVWNGKLYVGTENSNDGAEIWAYDGENWEILDDAGVNDSSNSAIESMIVYNGKLWFGTQNTPNDAKLYSCIEGATCSQYSIAFDANTNRVPSMTIANGNLYMGTGRTAGGAFAYRFEESTGASSSWDKLNAAAGFGDANNLSIESLLADSSNQYAYTDVTVGTNNTTTGLEMWSYRYGSSFSSVSTDGFGLASRVGALSMVSFNGSVYVGIKSTIGAASIYQLRDSYNEWEAVGSFSGLANADDEVSAMTVYNGKLYALVRGTGGGFVLARYNPESFAGGAWTYVVDMDSSNDTAGSFLMPYNGKLYFPVTDDTTGDLEIWEYSEHDEVSNAINFQADGEIASLFFKADATGQANENRNSGGSFVMTHSLLTNAGAYDLAEDWPTEYSDIEAGDVVAVDPYKKVHIKKGSKDDSPIGIISTEPGYVLSQIDDGRIYRPVALAGRVPVKITDENGPVKAGDLLTPASTAGYAMKLVGSGPVIGKALEDYDFTDSGDSTEVAKELVESALEFDEMIETSLDLAEETQEILDNIENNKEILETIENDESFTKDERNDIIDEKEEILSDELETVAEVLDIEGQVDTNINNIDDIEQVEQTIEQKVTELENDANVIESAKSSLIKSMDKIQGTGRIMVLVMNSYYFETEEERIGQLVEATVKDYFDQMASGDQSYSQGIVAPQIAADIFNMEEGIDTTYLAVNSDVKIYGDLYVEGNLVVAGDVRVEGNLEVEDKLYVSNEMSGTAVIASADQTLVEVNFNNPFEEVPRITVTPELLGLEETDNIFEIWDGRYVITSKDKDGFIINIAEPLCVGEEFDEDVEEKDRGCKYNLNFDWIAFGVVADQNEEINLNDEKEEEQNEEQDPNLYIPPDDINRASVDVTIMNGANLEIDNIVNSLQGLGYNVKVGRDTFGYFLDTEMIVINNETDGDAKEEVYTLIGGQLLSIEEVNNSEAVPYLENSDIILILGEDQKQQVFEVDLSGLVNNDIPASAESTPAEPEIIEETPAPEEDIIPEEPASPIENNEPVNPETPVDPIEEEALPEEEASPALPEADDSAPASE